MGQTNKATEKQIELIGLIDVYEKWKNGESIISLSEQLEINEELLENWLNDVKSIEIDIQSNEDYKKKAKIWKKMYLKSAFKLEKTKIK